jgi:hypothetical protein
MTLLPKNSRYKIKYIYKKEWLQFCSEAQIQVLPKFSLHKAMLSLEEQLRLTVGLVEPEERDILDLRDLLVLPGKQQILEQLGTLVILDLLDTLDQPDKRH